MEENVINELSLCLDGGGEMQQSGTLIIDLRVIDINDNAPRFANDSYNFAVHENMGAGTKLGQVKATDPDEGRNGVVVYKLSHRSTADYGAMFAVDNTTGMVSLKAMLDYEKETSYVIYVMAHDKGDVSLTSDVSVTVTVIDVNDNAPYVVVKHMSLLDYAVIAEGSPVGSTLSYVAVSDVDSGRGGHVTCHVDDKQRFALHRTSTGDYKLVTAEVFDYELSPSYRVSLTCRDHGLPALITRIDVLVRVEDRNDFVPVFDQRTYIVTISESTAINSEILSVHAFDNDTGDSGRITYSLDTAASDVLHVDPETGIIRTKIDFDFETAEQLECLIMASDEGTHRFTATATILLRLVNVDDEKPTFISKRYNFKVMENLPSGSPVGSVVAIDRDLAPFNALTYVFTEHSRNVDLFSIDANSGQIRTRVHLDRERYSSPLSLTVLASSVHQESGQLFSDVAIVTINIGDANDNAPVFESPRTNNLTIAVLPAFPAGSIVTRLFVTDADEGDNARITFSIAANLAAMDLFYVESDSALIGSLRLKRSLVTFEDASFPLTVIARDNGLPPLNATLSIVVRVTMDAAVRDDDDYAALSASHNSAMRTLMLCTIFVSVPIVVATIILLFICCLRKRLAKSARTVVVVKATNGKVTNGHVTSNNCYDKITTFPLADENAYHQMTSPHKQVNSILKQSNNHLINHSIVLK
jgi:protocadherin delta 1